MSKYLISKKNYNGEVVYLNVGKSKGYKISPKKGLNYEGVKVNEMVFIKPSFIEKIIKRKIKIKIDNYLKFLLCTDEDSDDSRIALGDLERYKVLVNEKYSIYLDEKYMYLLNKKLNTIERQLKSRIISSIAYEEKEIQEEQVSRRR